MNTIGTSNHSQRSTSARRKTYSPTQAVTAMSKQSHHHHRHVFATPSPVKGNFSSMSYDTDPSASPSTRSVPDKRKQHQTLSPHSSKRGPLEHPTNITPTKQLPFFSPTRAPPSPHHKPRASSPLRSSAISPVVIIKRPE